MQRLIAAWFLALLGACGGGDEETAEPQPLACESPFVPVDGQCKLAVSHRLIAVSLQIASFQWKLLESKEFGALEIVAYVSIAA